MDDYRELKLKDYFNGRAREFIKQKILESDFNPDGRDYDDFGAELEASADTFTVLSFLYKFYFRAEVHGVENLPVDSAGLMVSNHAPILPFDACMIGISVLLEPETPRYIRTVVNKTISSIPFFSTLMYRTGQVIGCDENVRRVFENDSLMLVFPTGAEGSVHSIFNKYHMDKFTVGFMEYALRYRTPIIPTCVTGSEESAMALGEIDLPVAGFKHLPITPIFPWLGPLGLIPFPSKFDIYFEEPVDYFTEYADDISNPEKVRELVDDLHSRIRNMLDRALEK